MKTIPNYIARPDGGHFTFSNGKRHDLDEICIFGIEPSPFTRETRASDCAVQSALIHDGEWREATDDELDELSNDADYMAELVWSVVEDYTTD